MAFSLIFSSLRFMFLFILKIEHTLILYFLMFFYFLKIFGTFKACEIYSLDCALKPEKQKKKKKKQILRAFLFSSQGINFNTNYHIQFHVVLKVLSLNASPLLPVSLLLFFISIKGFFSIICFENTPNHGFGTKTKNMNRKAAIFRKFV